MFGFHFDENFNYPYIAKSVTEFWRRWHISLSSWFRDYVYIPLGGNRKGNVRKWIHVLIVFLISGFWHGAGMNFIVWGLLHGVYQIIGHFWTPCKEKLNAELTKLGGWKQHTFDVFVTFNLVNFAWIFFRSDSVKSAIDRIINIFTSQKISTLFDGTLYEYGISERAFGVLILFIALLIVVDVCKYKSIDVGLWVRQRFLLYRWGIWIIGILCVLIFGIYGIGYDASDFIYMKF
jgi:D-alanyl-lipoteichoic acid acyltransferase DltB (MBOAT superfamily)